MILKKLFLLCLISGLGLSLNAQSYVLQASDLTVNSNGIITGCSYDFTNKDITIPNSVNGIVITGIADVNVFGSNKIFYGKGITNINLPEGIKTIGENAFKGNDLTSVILPNGLERIGASAFSGNDFNFKTIDIPNSVTFIGEYAFSMNGIDSITLPNVSISGFYAWIDNNGNQYAGGTKVKYTGDEYRAIIYYTLQDDDVEVNEDGMITSCSYDFSNTDIIIPEVLDGVTVKGIADEGYYSGVFADKGITSIQFPSTFTHIGNYALRDNELLNINIPNGVKYIGAQAFSGNNMNNVDLPNSVIYIGTQAFWGIDLIQLPTPTEEGFEYWICSNGNIYQGGEKVNPMYSSFEAKIVYTLTDSDVRIINGVIDTCYYDFSNKYIKIPDSLDNQRVRGIANGKEISYYNYYGVFSKKGIKEIQLPKYLKNIGDYAFYENDLDSIIFLPDSVKYIGMDAFTLNSSFKGVVLPSPTKEDLVCKNWIDNYGNIHEIGDTITNFYETSYSAQYTYAPGTSVISLSGTLTFDDVAVGTNETKTLTISNEGNAPFTVSDIILPEGYSADWTNGDITTENTQTVNITFSPIAEKNYNGMIKIISDATKGKDSIAVSGTGIIVSSISETANYENFKIYPNPATTYIILPQKINSSNVLIYNIKGKLIYNKEINTNKINIEGLEKGEYLLKIQNSKFKIQTKFIKI